MAEHAHDDRRSACDGARTLGALARIANAPFIAVIWIYRMTLSPLVGRYCRFTPTCSQYALEAYRAYGPIAGTRLTLWRLARCQPLARGGYDPVPVRPACGVRHHQTSDGKAHVVENPLDDSFPGH